MQAIRHRSGPRSTVLAIAGGLVLSLGTADVASAAKTSKCSLSSTEQRTLAPGAKKPRYNHYTMSLSARSTTCTAAKRIVRSYYSCRFSAGGPTGRCRKKVRGYSCTERRGKIVNSQFDATATCTASGGRRVVHKYTQFTA